MNSIPIWLLILVLLMGIAMPTNESVNVETATVEAAPIAQSYGPGHETHQFAAWDNGDGTHSVACDCGIEKRIELHADKDSDDFCDICGLEY